jgi:hypothetical protein
VDKKIAHKIRELETKEREEKKSKRTNGTQLTQAKQATQREIEKEDRTKFNDAWFVATIKAINERFHNNFRVGFQAHL